MDMVVEVGGEAEEEVEATEMEAGRDGTEEVEEARGDTVPTLTRIEEEEAEVDNGTVLLHTWRAGRLVCGTQDMEPWGGNRLTGDRYGLCSVVLVYCRLHSASVWETEIRTFNTDVRDINT